MSATYSLQLEKHALGGLIRHPKALAEVDRWISEKDFYSEVHSVIFSVIKNTILEKQEIDKVLLSERITNLGISFKDDIKIFDYIESISFTQITFEHTIECAQDLAFKTIRREMKSTGLKIAKIADSEGNKTLDEFVSECDATYGDRVKSYSFSNEPELLFDGISDLVEDRGNSPQEESGFRTPYGEFNRLYGGLRPGNIYSIGARPGAGKTTFVNDLAFKTSVKNNLKVLVLDTEMSTTDIKFRMASSITGVPVWFLETGNWRKNPTFVEKVRSSLKDIRNLNYFHFSIGNKTMDQVCSLIRRWYLSNVKRGEPCIIVYDYLKLALGEGGDAFKSSQDIGRKVDALKRLAEEINAIIITAIQLNKTAEKGRNSFAVDDSSAIALSDQLQWFASFVALFRVKEPEEIALDGPEFGTHKLIPTKTRFQGKDAAGQQDIIKRLFENGVERYVRNYLNFNVTDFNIEERGSLRDVDLRVREQYELNDGANNDGDLL